LFAAGVRSRVGFYFRGCRCCRWAHSRLRMFVYLGALPLPAPPVLPPTRVPAFPLTISA
jgi:hypothetical protein